MRRASARARIVELLAVRRDDVGETEDAPVEPAGRRRIEHGGRAGGARRPASAARTAAVGISWLTSTTSPGPTFAASSAAATSRRGRASRWRPGATAMTFSPSGCDEDQRDAGRHVRDASASPATSTPARRERRARARSPNASSPIAPMNATRAPSRAAATAWLPPLPPSCCANVAPLTVSPALGNREDERDEIDVDRPDDDDAPTHRHVLTR